MLLITAGHDDDHRTVVEWERFRFWQAAEANDLDATRISFEQWLLAHGRLSDERPERAA